MHEPLPDGGMIRKLWIGETDAYRDHLLRLDRESRNRRFSGAVSDDFIARHAASADGFGVVVHGFFVDGVLARRRRTAPDRLGVRARGGSRLQHRAALAEPWRRHRIARTHAAERAQPRHQIVAHALPRRQPAHAAARPQVRGRSQVRFRQRGRARSIRRALRRCRWCARRSPMRTASRPQFSTCSRGCSTRRERDYALSG